jgi:hypothetical protein
MVVKTETTFFVGKISSGVDQVLETAVAITFDDANHFTGVDVADHDKWNLEGVVVSKEDASRVFIGCYKDSSNKVVGTFELCGDSNIGFHGTYTGLASDNSLILGGYCWLTD